MANLLVRHVESNLRPFRNPPSESYSPRIGISGLLDLRLGLGPADLESPKLPAWRWFKLRKQLRADGLAPGETLSEAEAVYLIDNGLATGRRP